MESFKQNLESMQLQAKQSASYSLCLGLPRRLNDAWLTYRLVVDPELTVGRQRRYTVRRMQSGPPGMHVLGSGTQAAPRVVPLEVSTTATTSEHRCRHADVRCEYVVHTYASLSQTQEAPTVVAMDEQHTCTRK